MNNKNKYHRYSYILVSVVFSFVFYLQNTKVPFFSDDLGWLNTLSADGILGKIGLLIETQTRFWLEQNGRIANHTLLQVLINGGESAYDIGIAFILFFTFLVFVRLFYLFDDVKGILPLVLLTLFVFYLAPASSSNLYWAAGGCNYLFPALMTCCTLLLLKKSEGQRKLSWYHFFFSLFCFVAGWTHEVYSLPVSFAIVMSFIYKYIKKEKLSPYQLCLIIPYLIGSALVFCSPGSWNRIANEGGFSQDLPFYSIILSKFLTSFKIFRYGRYFYGVVILLIVSLLSKQIKLKQFIFNNYFIFSCWISALGIVVLLGAGGRAIWSVEIFSLIIIIRWILAHEIIQRFSYYNFGILVMLLLMVHQIVLIKPMQESWQTYKEVVSQVSDSDFAGTAKMKEWKSGDFYIDRFVAHPYQMIREDYWMRAPLKCEICREDVYERLEKCKEKEITTFTTFGEDIIIEYSDSIMNKIYEGAIQMNLAPITYKSKGGFLYLTWHQLIQNIMPTRYPMCFYLSNNNVSKLNIGNREFLRVEKPWLPVEREIDLK